MTALADRIAQFRKMATDDPDNELGHFRLGQLLVEDGQTAEAIPAFRRTIELAPEFSKAYQLLGEALAKAGDPAEAVKVLTLGWATADGRGDKMPRDAMGKLLTELGAPIPKPAAAVAEDDGPETGFRCERPGCPSGKRARPLDKPPVAGPVGVRIQQHICAGCWDAWFKDYSIKVINELRLDLSNEYGSGEYDKHMREFFGFEDAPAA
jgi:Fe-S cluster biosynthesis and repair protein YggX